MKILDNNMDASSYITSSNDMLWANIIASPDIADRTGTWYYYDTPDYLGTGTRGDLTGFSMYFAVDFDASANQISSGTLNLDVGVDPYSSGPLQTWETTFTGGTINGALAEFVGINGNVDSYYSGSPTSICTACVTGDIRGAFTGTLDASTNNGGGFVAGFSLNNSLGDSVIGLGLLDGTDILD